YGSLSDKIGWKITTNLFALISAVVLVLGMVLSGYPGAVTFAILAGSLTYIGMVGALALPEVYGNKEAGNLIGFSLAAGSLGAMVGPPLAGIIYDVTGTYNGFLIISAIFSVL